MDFVGFYQIDCHINLWELRIYVNIVINRHRIHNTKTSQSMAIIHTAHYKLLKVHKCVMLWHVYGYAFSNRQICIAWSIKNIWICTICGCLGWWMPKKYFSLSLCECEIENRVGIAPLRERWGAEMWIDLHAHVKCFRARFILSSSWFIDWVTFWYFLHT